MQRVQKRNSYLNEKSDTCLKRISSIKARSTSTRNLSPTSAFQKLPHRENLSLVRSSPSLIKNTPKKHEFKIGKRPTRLQTLSSKLVQKIKNTKDCLPKYYFKACQFAMQELINLNHPVSELLEIIKQGYEDEIKTRSEETRKKDEEMLEHSGGEEIGRRAGSVTFMNRLKEKKEIRKHIGIKFKKERNETSSIPKLNIKNVQFIKQGSSEKITGTGGDTLKQVMIKDYQDEFMAKFEEFSESWRLQILDKQHHLC